MLDCGLCKCDDSRISVTAIPFAISFIDLAIIHHAQTVRFSLYLSPRELVVIAIQLFEFNYNFSELIDYYSGRIWLISELGERGAIWARRVGILSTERKEW